MNLEKQNRTEVSDLILGGAATGFLIYLLIKYANKDIKSHTIPPIIIKSKEGEITCESDTGLDDSSFRSSNSTTIAPLLLPNKYKKANFGKVKGIEIQYEDSEINKIPFRHTTSNLQRGVRVEIWLQVIRNNSSRWEWVDRSTPQIIIRGYDIDLVVEVDNELSPSEPKKHPNRKSKNKYRGNANTDYRFGRILIYDGNTNSLLRTPYESDPNDQHDFGDQYSLAFHKER